MTAPVVLVAFNRPEITRRTLDRIRAAQPSRLFLLADGPRPGRPEDVELCADVRRELDAVDWPCEVRRLYREVNIGAEASVELGLDWVFDQVEEAIILEDDCLPGADFFAFCSSLLSHHRETAEVWQISGRAPNVAPEVLGGASYSFTAVGAIWGWATWRRAWQAHRRLFPRDHGGGPTPRLAGLDDLSGSRLATRAGRRYFADVARNPDGNGFGWDSYWALSIVRQNGLVATSRSNLITNIGFGADATHAGAVLPEPSLEAVQWPLRHPPELAVNPTLERSFERMLVAHVGRVARFVAPRLANSRARVVVRAIVGFWRDRRTRAVVR
jgi:hypothetical protein